MKAYIVCTNGWHGSLVWHDRKWSFNVYMNVQYSPDVLLLLVPVEWMGVRQCILLRIIISPVLPHAGITRRCSALSGPSQCSQTWRASVIKPQGRREYRNFFFFYIRRGQRKKKILKLKWGNSTNYHLSQSNPVTIAKNMERCKHGNRLLIWM